MIMYRWIWIFIYFFLWWEGHKNALIIHFFYLHRQVNKALRYILVDSIFFVECYVMWHFLNRHLREVTPHISFIFLNFKNQTHFNHSVVFLIICTKNQFILYVLHVIRSPYIFWKIYYWLWFTGQYFCLDIKN